MFVYTGPKTASAPAVRRGGHTQLSMFRVTENQPSRIPDEITVKRSDPIYNAHAYLTKVPYSAIVPCIEASTEPGDVVLDVFAGSGMTGVAAAMLGRSSELRDISKLGYHIGFNYLNLVDRQAFTEVAAGVVRRTREAIATAYRCECSACGTGEAELSKTVWSYEYECQHCMASINYFEAYRRTGWVKKDMACSACGELFVTRGSKRVGEVPVVDFVRCCCSKKLIEQAPSFDLASRAIKDAKAPDVQISPNRQMYQASALAKHNLTSTAKFFSPRNLAVLGTLHQEIEGLEDEALRSKMLFAFTAILARASKRYQWHPKRPLNASNQNYYIAPVFYEWNVFELFERKVRAALASDAFIRQRAADYGVTDIPASRYVCESSEKLDLPDGSVDYVFTDPPFGSQLFYSDMALFQEAWIGEFTDPSREAVVDRAALTKNARTEERYSEIVIGSLRECHRVLKDDGMLSLVFSNSNGAMWDLVQKAVARAGFKLDHVTLLDKGQRSVKGLTSGFESVVTSDLILTMSRSEAVEEPVLEHAPEGAISNCIDHALTSKSALTPTRIYLSIITEFLHNNWRASEVTMEGIRDELVVRDYTISPTTGVLTQNAVAAA